MSVGSRVEVLWEKIQARRNYEFGYGRQGSLVRKVETEDRMSGNARPLAGRVAYTVLCTRAVLYKLALQIIPWFEAVVWPQEAWN